MPNKNPGHPASEQSQERVAQDNGIDKSDSFDEEVAADQSLEMLTKLGRTIEIDVIPRLMQAINSRQLKQSEHAHGDVRFAAEVEDFIHLLLMHDTDVAVKYLTTIRATGVPLAAIYLDLLAPAARRAGELWESDEASFADVTVIVCRMRQVLLEFSRCFDAPAESSSKNRNVLLLPSPGEQHTFGLLMVVEFLRREAWNCFSGTPIDLGESEKIINAQKYRVIGLSISADRHIDATTSLIRWIRKSSSNSEAAIIIGGRAVLENPDLVKTVGADTMASDGEEAVRTLDQLTRQQAGARAK